MTDAEKVIKGLECCNAPNNHDECPYDGEAHTNICTHKLLNDAVDLLKRLEKKTVDMVCKHNNSLHTGICPTCGKVVNSNCNRRFCGECGQELKWHD